MTGNPLSAWSFPRNSSWSTGFTSLKDLKISPASLNSIFPIAFNGNPNTDEFLCHFFFKATKVSNMSVNGLPIL